MLQAAAKCIQLGPKPDPTGMKRLESCMGPSLLNFTSPALDSDSPWISHAAEPWMRGARVHFTRTEHLAEEDLGFG